MCLSHTVFDPRHFDPTADPLGRRIPQIVFVQQVNLNQDRPPRGPQVPKILARDQQLLDPNQNRPPHGPQVPEIQASDQQLYSVTEVNFQISFQSNLD